jgi:hypothetical protein
LTKRLAVGEHNSKAVDAKVAMENHKPSCVPCGIVWLNRHSLRVDTNMDTKQNAHDGQILRLDLVSIFRPNRGDLVDFRDFGDCVSFR